MPLITIESEHLQLCLLISNIANEVADNSDSEFTPGIFSEIEFLLNDTVKSLDKMNIAIGLNSLSTLPVAQHDFLTTLLKNAITSFYYLNHFYESYLDDITDHGGLDSMDLFLAGDEIKHGLVALAFAKTAQQNDIIPGFNRFRDQVLSDYKKWIEDFKKRAAEINILIPVEPLDLVTQTNGYLELKVKELETTI